MTAFLIWDTQSPPPVGDWTILLWRDHLDNMQDSAAVSMPEKVELRADELRARYLGCIYDIGEMRIGTKSVIDHLELRPGFSYWWMSSIAQKFNASGESSINDILKLMALEDILATGKATSVVLHSNNRDLAAVVRNLCKSLAITFQWRSIEDLSRKCRSKHKYLPNLWRAFIYLGWYVLMAWPFLLKKRPLIAPLVGRTILIDILVHLDKRAFLTNTFISNYWTSLVGKLSDWKVRANWLHVFYRYPAMPTPTKAASQLDRFNLTSGGGQLHMLLERSLTFRVLLNVLRDYFLLRSAFNRLGGVERYKPTRSALNWWPLQAREWRDSLCGKEAMTNCLWLALFEGAMNRIPTQKLGIYIQENQPWEMALIYAWKAAGHKTLVGTPHATVRYWDLRYHYDSRSYADKKRNRLPTPDMLAVNGPAAHATMLGSGYPTERITHVEALRFLHLSKPPLNNTKNDRQRSELNVLICADFLATTNRLMLSWLEIAARSLPNDTAYVLKPHPAYSISVEDFKIPNLKVSEKPLSCLLADCDVVFASNSTSAAVDAYCTGLPVIQMLDGNSVNLSPLRGMEGVTYVTSPTQLSSALRNSKGRKCGARTSYFNLDNELTGWRRVIQ